MNPKFHLSLDVENLDDSVRFYSTLFGVPPTKLTADYAQVEIEKPALNLILQPKGHCCLQGLNHMGLPIDTVEEVEAVKARLTAAGYPTQDDTNARCCYAVHDKFWVRDPSRYRWEVYVVKADPETASSNKACCG
jgi:catechol 2,3-dioxygenase-like lactoylglutathione lyase family enzyme